MDPEIINLLRWPAVILILGLVIVALFHKELKKFISKMKIKYKGLSFEQDNPTQDASEDHDKNASAIQKDFLTTPALGTQEDLIRKDIKEKGINDASSLVDVLIQQLAASQLMLHFEITYQAIWGSQLRLLQYLNSYRLEGVIVDATKVFYNTVIAEHPSIESSYPFENYINFLVIKNLATKSDNNLLITELGVEFLAYLTRTGKTFGKPN